MGTSKEGKNGRTPARKIGLGLGSVLFVLFMVLPSEPSHPMAGRMAAVAVLMAAWWLTDAIPIAATALLPLVLFPLLGISKAGQIAPVYINSTIFLFIGGFVIALSMEQWGLHRRIALWIIRLIGSGPSMIILAFMTAAAFLSMWISNTATAIMMLPIGLAIVRQMEDGFGHKTSRNFTLALLIGIAYGCSVGGMATIVGTPPNLVFARIFKITFPGATAVTFGQWFVMALPLAAVMLMLAWVVLTQVMYRPSRRLVIDRSIVEKEYSALGKIGFEEMVVLVVFTVTALLWVFRKKLVIGSLTIPGWSMLLPYPAMIDDGSVAVAMALILFLVPSKSRNGASAIAGTDVIRRLPWDIVMLFGGGFALAKGFQVSGLSSVIGSRLSALSGISPFFMMVTVCLVITFLTELTSNTATTATFLPILASVAIGLKINPLILMIPATLSASCAFMMPVATPPNAIVFGSGRIKISQMAKAGVVMNLLGVVVISLFFYLVGTTVFSIEPGSFPAWANF